MSMVSPASGIRRRKQVQDDIEQKAAFLRQKVSILVRPKDAVLVTAGVESEDLGRGLFRITTAMSDFEDFIEHLDAQGISWVEE